MRVRPGAQGVRRAAVVDLAAFKAARQAVDTLHQLLGPVPWLLDVRVAVPRSGVPLVVATIAGLDHWKDCCVPSHIDSVEVRTRDAGERRRP